MKTIESAHNLWSKGEEAEAILLLRNAVSQGNDKARSALGFYLCHFHENGKFPYLTEGHAILEQACSDGDGCACHNLGSLCSVGQPSIGNDLKVAASYYIKARDLGFVVADDGFYDRWLAILNG